VKDWATKSGPMLGTWRYPKSCQSWSCNQPAVKSPGRFVPVFRTCERARERVRVERRCNGHCIFMSQIPGR
jgi:hypothetical protein